MTLTEVGEILRPALDMGDRITTIEVPPDESIVNFQQIAWRWLRRYSSKGVTVAREKMGDGTFRLVILRRNIPAE